MKSQKFVLSVLVFAIAASGISGFGLIFNDLAQAQGVPESNEPGIAIPQRPTVQDSQPDPETNPQPEVEQEPEIDNQAGGQVPTPEPPTVPSISNEVIEEETGGTTTSSPDTVPTSRNTGDTQVVTTPVTNTPVTPNNQPTQVDLANTQTVTPRSGGLEIGLGLIAFSLMASLLWYYHKHGNIKSLLHTAESKLPKQRRSK